MPRLLLPGARPRTDGDVIVSRLCLQYSLRASLIRNWQLTTDSFLAASAGAITPCSLSLPTTGRCRGRIPLRPACFGRLEGRLICDGPVRAWGVWILSRQIVLSGGRHEELPSHDPGRSDRIDPRSSQPRRSAAACGGRNSCDACRTRRPRSIGGLHRTARSPTTRRPAGKSSFTLTSI